MTTITAELLTGYRVDINNGTHMWRADEPVDLGGSNTGPNPYDMLLGALAACTVITLTMYARRKDINITSLSVRYTHDRIHHADCENCDQRHGAQVEQVTSEVFIDGDFDEETRQRLMGVATRCPVHKTLEKGLVFDDTVYAG